MLYIDCSHMFHSSILKIGNSNEIKLFKRKRYLRILVQKMQGVCMNTKDRVSTYPYFTGIGFAMKKIHHSAINIFVDLKNLPAAKENRYVLIVSDFAK